MGDEIRPGHPDKGDYLGGAFAGGGPALQEATFFSENSAKPGRSDAAFWDRG